MTVCQKNIFQPGYLSALIMIAVVGRLIYAGTFSAPFVYDDIMNIVENPHIRMTAVTPSEVANAFKSFSSNRPFANLTFAVNYYVHGYELYGYHLVNLLIHMAVALLVFVVTRQTMALLALENPRMITLTPLLASLLWLVNPLHVQSVTYIVQRMNALAALFYLLSLACYIEARKSWKTGKAGIRSLIFFGLCALSAFFGLVSKETAATLPVIILAYEVYFFRDLDLSWMKKQRWLIYAGLAAILGLSLIYMEADPAAKLAAMYDKQNFTMSRRLLTQPLVVIYYVSLLFFPYPGRLNLVYNFPLSTGLLTTPATLAALAAITAILLFIMAGARRHKLISFALLWFLVTLAVESTFLGLALVFEHRTYLPSVFPVITISYLMLRYLKPAPVLVLVMAAMIVASAAWTHQRNNIWSNEISLWSDNAAKTPANAMVWNNLGMAFRTAGQEDKAFNAFEQAVLLNPNLETALNNMGMMLRDRGEPEAALVYLKKAIQLTPHYYNAWYNLGLAYYDLGRLRPATEAFRQAVIFNPLYESAHNNLGIALMQQEYPEQALACFQNALQINPVFKKAYSNIGIALLRMGQTEQALRAFNKALDIDPFFLDAYNNIRRTEALEEQHGNQIRKLKEQFSRHPDSPVLSYQLAEIYKTAGRTAAAMSQYQVTLDLKPDHIQALNQLGNLYARRHRFEEAAAVFQTLAGILPEVPVIRYNMACMNAMAGQKEKAVTELKKAIELGYADFDRIRTDPDLENIRDTDDYRQLFP